MTADQLTAEFETFHAELKSFLLRMTASVQDAEDILQDTYIKAQAKIDTFRGDSSLKTWIFSIASNLARDLLRSKKRWPETVTDICREETLQIRETSPQGKFEIKEHIAFCFTCVSKSLPLEQHLARFSGSFDFSDFAMVKVHSTGELFDNIVGLQRHFPFVV